MTLEKNLESRCVEYARSRGCYGMKIGDNGWPDRLFFWGHERHFWVEFKKDAKSRFQPLQPVIAKMLLRWGEDFKVVDDFKEFTDLLHVWEITYGPATAIRPA